MTLAPDAASRRAAAGLAHPGPWTEAGCDDRAVWGRCRGSAREPYSVAVDVGRFAYRCSCPSQKQPCKHVLALLVLWAGCSSVLSVGSPPSEVAAWLANRTDPAAGSPLADLVADLAPEGRSGGPVEPAAPDVPPAGAGRGSRPVDPEAAAARATQRAERIGAGMAELDRWLTDLLRAGLASAASQPYSFWDSMAARLVDAQAPGAAAAVRDLAGVPYTGEDWPGRLLGGLARLHLLACGWARYPSLPEETRADLRTAAGWPWPAGTVLAGPHETDRWYVLARVAIDDPQLKVQRTWLWGMESDRPALVLDFARPGTAFAWQLWPGDALEAEVARYPGSAPLRVLIAEATSEPTPAGPPPGWDDLTELAAARGRALALDPWSERWPVSVRQVVPDQAESDGSSPRWVVRDRDGRMLDLTVGDETGWKLVAVSGGHPVHLLGEWTPLGVAPLGVWAEDRMVVL